jgi:hypothetical protein
MEELSNTSALDSLYESTKVISTQGQPLKSASPFHALPQAAKGNKPTTLVDNIFLDGKPVFNTTKRITDEELAMRKSEIEKTTPQWQIEMQRKNPFSA